MGDKANAYIYLDKYYSIKDSLNFEKDRSKFNELEKKYPSKMKDQELTYFKNLNEVNQLSLSQNKIVIGAMIGLFIFGVLLAYFFIRNQKLVAKKNSRDCTT